MKKFLVIFIIGLVVKITLSAFTLHPDIRGHNYAAYLIAQQGKLFTFYDHMRQLPRDNPLVLLYHDDLFIYPPLAYLTHAVFNWLTYPLQPHALFSLLIQDIGQTSGQPGLPVLVFLLKLPYLVADLLALVVVRKIFAGKHQLTASIVWWLNPVTLYASYLLAQFDIFIALFLLLAYHYRQLAPVFVALAAGFKPFPLLLLPFLPGNKFRNLAIGLFVYMLLILPYLPSIGFRQYALLASQSDKITYAKILVSASQYLPLFFVGLVLLFWRNFSKAQDLPEWGWPLSVLLLFFSLTHFHPQWFVWATPFLLFSFVLRPRTRLPIFSLLGSYALIILSFEPSLNFGLFNLPYSLQPLLTDANISLVRAVFAAGSVAVIDYARS